MAKQNNNVNELEEVKKLTSSISKLTDELIKKSDKRGKTLKNEANTLKSIISRISDQDSINSAILQLEKSKLRVSTVYFGVNEKIKNELIEIYNLSLDILKVESKKIDVIDKVKDKADKVAESMKNSLITFKSQIEEIPILGKVFSKLIPTEFLNKKIHTIAENFKTSFNKSYSKVNGEGKGFVRSLSQSLSSGLRAIFANPLMTALSLFALVAAAGVLAFYKISEAAKQFRQETGLLRSQTKSLEGNIKSVYLSTVGLGASMEDVAQSAAAFTREFKNLEQPSKQTLTSIVALNKNFGVLPETASQVTKLLRDMTGASADQSQYFTNQVALLSQMAGVAPQQVLQDIADSSEDVYKYFNGSQKQLKWAGIYAAKMGTSIKKMSESARGLLDFESSITDQMQASAILGRNLNLNQARYFAMTGNTVKMHEAIGKEVDKLGDITKLNVIQQEALAKATGMPFQDLVEQQKIRKQFGKLDAQQMEALKKQIDAGKDITDITKKDLDIQAAAIIKQKEMQSEFDNLINKLKEFGMTLFLSLEPIGRAIMNSVEPVMKFLNSLKQTVTPAFNNIKDAAMAIIEPLQRMFGLTESKFGVAETLGKVFGGAFNLIINTVAVLFKGIGNFITAFEKFGQGDILGGIKDALLGTLRVFVPGWKWIEGGIKTAMDLFPEFGEKVNSVIERVKSAFDSLTNMFSFGKKGEEEFKTVENAGMNFMQKLLLISVALGMFGKKLFSVFSSPFRAIGKLGKSILTPFSIFSSKSKEVEASNKSMQKSSTSGLSKIGKGIGDLGKGIGTVISSIAKGIGTAVSSIAKGIGTAVSSIAKGIGTAISSIATGIGSALTVLGKGIGTFISAIMKGIATGIGSFAAAAPGLPIFAAAMGIVTLAVMGFAYALKIAGPALEPFGKMIKSIFEGAAAVVVPIVNKLVDGITSIANIVKDAFIGTIEQLGITLGILLDKVSLEKVGAIALLGGALVSLSLGLAAISAGNLIGNVLDGFGRLFGAQSPLQKIETMAQFADKIALLAFGMDIFAKSISTVVSSLKNLDIDKWEDFAKASGNALKETFKGATLQVQPAGIQQGAAGLQERGIITTQITSSNERVIAKLEEVKQALLRAPAPTVYLDGDRVSNSVTRNQNQRRTNTGTDMRTM